MKHPMQVFTAATAFAFLLGGCGTELPKCGDKRTTSLVLEVLSEQLATIDNLDITSVRARLALDFPLSTALDDRIQRYSCEATLVVSGGYRTQIGYSSQVNDNSRHVVKINGMSVIEVIPLRLALASAIAKAKALVPKKAPEPWAPITSARPPAVPSFDCRKASIPSEQAVCTNPLLARLDEALAENYRYMLLSDIGDGARSDLRQTQRAWLATRNKCTDSNCLQAAYRSRLESVCEYPVLTGIHPACTTSADVE
jgi:uncharacterized protein YecT (DUF1311 family)